MPNLYEPIDLVSIALQLGATFVARSFSGDKGQLVPLIRAALLHKGFAFIDVISPCVAFNNHRGSTKSYDYVRDHRGDVVSADFVPAHDEILADYAPGAREDVAMPDGSILQLRKLAANYDAHDRVAALSYVQRKQGEGEVVTGLLYLDQDAVDCHAILETVETPLNALNEVDLCPGEAALRSINASFR